MIRPMPLLLALSMATALAGSAWAQNLAQLVRSADLIVVGDLTVDGKTERSHAIYKMYDVTCTCRIVSTLKGSTDAKTLPVLYTLETQMAESITGASRYILFFSGVAGKGRYFLVAGRDSILDHSDTTEARVALLIKELAEEEASRPLVKSRVTLTIARRAPTPEEVAATGAFLDASIKNESDRPLRLFFQGCETCFWHSSVNRSPWKPLRPAAHATCAFETLTTLAPQERITCHRLVPGGGIKTVKLRFRVGETVYLESNELNVEP
ncbi:MAG: hypothetical protein HY815_22510 [Candidatus Riflebacteria bacterium]|nr:hypothetical protein [Candidatus Riflebacteria bacterium]